MIPLTMSRHSLPILSTTLHRQHSQCSPEMSQIASGKRLWHIYSYLTNLVHTSVCLKSQRKVQKQLNTNSSKSSLSMDHPNDYTQRIESPSHQSFHLIHHFAVHTACYIIPTLPQSNGFIERNVRTIKEALAKTKD